MAPPSRHCAEGQVSPPGVFFNVRADKSLATRTDPKVGFVPGAIPLPRPPASLCSPRGSRLQLKPPEQAATSL
ncbi:hypothetical protein NDU88_006076 [Pleurodeles waltl]|uniref:Uncharacterized protein n=1 Tax=Pleurodeles waltl TaxID=8319 RepID=A0AAV7WF66_PLEWA|nr:hypothetical protein NDU88_006076 [Pleurodeles waltl]